MFEFDSSTDRRLPVYLLLDVSGSMSGAPIQAVNQGVQLLLTELRNDPQALETAYVSCITFDDDASEVLPLTEIGHASIPQLSSGGRTNLGAALKMLIDKMKQEVRPNSPQQKGDWKPLVFIMSDGQPTDYEWPKYASELNDQVHRKTANVIALACGQGIDTDVLKQITPTVLLMQDITPDNIRSFFKWVSQSVRIASQKTVDPGISPDAGEATVSVPPPPPSIQLVL